MPDLIADRFVTCGAWQLDLASGAPVQLYLLPAGHVAHQVVWSDRCATAARLRHPLLNPLVDYGVVDRDHLFEAYATSPPIRVSGSTAARLIAHAKRFLESQAVSFDPPRATRAMRLLVHGPASRSRPIGVVLQSRRVLDAIGDALREAAPGGVVAVDVEGEVGSGLRTVWTLAARAARLAGYVPLAPGVLDARPWLTEALESRHVALLVERGRAGSAAGAVVRLGAASTRRHVLLTFGRAAGNPHALRIDPMGGSALRAMVYIDRHEGPTMTELGNAVHGADGRPGALVERLGSVHWADRARPVSVVHETTPAYVVETGSTPVRPAGCVGRRLQRAPERAAQLVAHGRHAAAGRLLDRATRVLSGRGEARAAARCALARGWVLRDRGRCEAAIREFEQARLLAGDDEVGVRAAIGIGVTWTDEHRLEPAEAILRSAQAAALLVDDLGAEEDATRALARCVLWQQRAGEAAALLRRGGTPARGVDHWALLTRVHLAERDLASAGHAAAHAVTIAQASGLARDRAVAARALTLARVAVGDLDGARTSAHEGTQAAAAAHLPLLGIRIRLGLLSAGQHDGPAARLGEQLRALARRGVPALLRHAIELACAAGADRPERSTPLHDQALADLRDLLESTQAASDDTAALQAVADAVLPRLRASAVMVVAARDTKAVARAGRPWPADAPIVLRCLASGVAVIGEAGPLECAAPIRYGGETIGALACRWSAGAAIEAERAGAACQAAALAASASLRGLANRAPVVEPNATWENLLGTSPPAGDLRRAILSAARAPFPVLVLGESGSGKELVARAIHRLGPRRHRRLCTINCAAISDELLEAELFGHTRGAFTGATSERAGLFEEADGGTLFLDEVGELTARAQAKLLRVLQDGEVRRVGENLPRRVDTRVVAATNRCLESEVAAGRFRADLRFRLDVIRIGVPPLRERATDIPALVAHFWEDAAARVGSRATLAPETVAALTRYDWPGNVRELQNAVASLAVHGPRRGRITPGILPHQVARSAAAEPASFEAARAEFERRYVRAALARAGGARARAARALGVSRQGLAKMLRRLDIDAPEGPAAS